MHQVPRSTVASLLFCSGMCALIYQTVWLREFRLIFGASTGASAAVLGIFMGGLGLGSAMLGRRAEAVRNPLRYYGDLELLIALLAALTPGLLWLVRWMYQLTGGSMVIGHGLSTILRLVLASIVLIGPTFLMGGTLPAAVRAIGTHQDRSRRSLALLYGVNTIGAVTGATLSTFWLIELTGNRAALWLACGLNALVALMARWLSRTLTIDPEAETTVEGRDVDPVDAARGKFVIVAAGVVGFAFMLMELVWYRMLSPILGGSTFTFGLILVVALLGIGLGGAAYTLRSENRVPSLPGFALSCGLEAFFLGLPFAIGDRLAFLALMLRPMGALGFASQVMGWAIVALIVIFPAALVAGYQFPMLIGLLGQGRRQLARQTGIAYAANTVGAITGSLAGGFGLLPLMTAPGVWRAVVILLGLLSLAAAFVGRNDRRKLGMAILAPAAAAGLMLLATGPSVVWRHGGIGAGRADTESPNINYLRAIAHAYHREIIWEAEGVESSVALNAGSGLAFVVNGKTDGNARFDAGTQVMSGVLGALLHPSLRRAMVVGLGTGSSAGWLGALPGVEKVDVVELEPAILEVARRCAVVNEDVMNNPKVHCHIGDAREVLLTTPEKYDLIFSEPSNPYRAGIASLFTADFYHSAKQRLAPGGIFVQWVQAYEIAPYTLKTVFATVATAFPCVQVWCTETDNLLLIGSETPLSMDAVRLRERIKEPVMRAALLNVWRADSLEGVLAHYVANEKLAESVARSGTEISTDDRNPLEYAFAHGVGRHESGSIAWDLKQYCLRNGMGRPVNFTGDVDWNLVMAAEVASDANEGTLSYAVVNEPAARAARRDFYYHYLRNDYSAAMLSAKMAKLKPLNPTDVEAFATAAVMARDGLANDYVTLLESYFPAEAQALRGCQAAGRENWEDAATGLVAAFAHWQKDPWVQPQLLKQCLEVARALALDCKQVPIANKLYDAFSIPFAVCLVNEERLTARVEIAKLCEATRVNKRVQDAMEHFAKYPIWSEQFLKDRFVVFRAMGDPRADSAEKDLLEFLACEPASFNEGLTPAAGPR